MPAGAQYQHRRTFGALTQPRRQRMPEQKTVAWLEEQLKARSTKIELGDIYEWSDDQLEQGGLLLAEYGDCVEELVGAAPHCHLTHCASQCTCGLSLRLLCVGVWFACGSGTSSLVGYGVIGSVFGPAGLDSQDKGRHQQ